MAVKANQIADKQLTEFAKITVANGYNTDVVKVAEAQAFAFQSNQLPAINIWDAEKEIDEYTGPATHLHTVRKELDLVVKDGTGIRELRSLIADVHKVVKNNITWGGYAENTRPGDVAYNITEDESKERKLKGATVSLIIQYKTSAWSEE